MSRRERFAGLGAPSLASLSPEKLALIKRRLAEKGLGEGARQAIPRRGDQSTAPLAFSQEALWFIEQMDPGKATYNIPCAVRLSGALDVKALEQSLGEIVRRHDVLRAVVVEEADGVPRQRVLPADDFRLPVEDITSTEPLEREREVSARALAYGQAPFDLKSGPLFAAMLLRFSDEEHVLLMRIHQLVTDGWSFGLFSRELEANYEAFRTGSRPSGSPLPIQFSDFAAWQRGLIQGEELERRLDYWRAIFPDGVPLLELPTDRPRPPMQSFRGAHHALRIPKGLSDELRVMARTEGVTLFVTLLAAFNVVLRRYSRQDDVVVGSAFANRTRQELEELIGYFVTVLPLMTRMGHNPTFRRLLQEVHDVNLSAAEQQELPMGKLVQEFEGARDPSRNPLFQVVFYLLTPDRNPFVYGFGISPGGGSEQMAGLTLTPVETECGISRFDIQVLIWDLEDGLSGTIEYSTDLFDEATIRRMSELYATVLRHVVARPDIATDELVTILDREDARRNELEHQASKQRMRGKLKTLRGRSRRSGSTSIED